MSAQQVLETRYAVAAPIAAQLGNVCDWVVRDFVMNWAPLISPAEPSQFPKYLTHVIARAIGKLSVGILGVTVRTGGQHLRPFIADHVVLDREGGQARAELHHRRDGIVHEAEGVQQLVGDVPVAAVEAAREARAVQVEQLPAARGACLQRRPPS